MSVITVVVLIFSVIGALDKLFGNKLGMGKEFERAFAIFAPMATSMLGVLIVAPGLGAWMAPVFEGFYNLFGLDPSIIPASFFANDMGGMTIAKEICKSQAIGDFNAFVVSSMMGCVISFTIPVSIGMVKKEQHKDLFFGILCGIVTIPIGCFVGGLMCGIGVVDILLNLLPLVILSVIIATGLALAPNVSIKIFSVFGKFMQAVGILGLVCGIFTFLTKIQLDPHFNSLQDAALICVNACITLSGALPFMHMVTRLLGRFMERISSKIGINSTSAVMLLSTLVTNTPTFGVMEKMNPKGVVLNSAFAVSAAFVVGSHMAFTMACDGNYLPAVMVSKLISGICALAVALLLYKDKQGEKQ